MTKQLQSTMQEVQSLKWQLYSNARRKVLAKGLIERIGLKDSISTVKFDGRSEQQILISKIIHKLLKFYWMI